VPDAKVAYFRAPGGNFTPALVSVARGLGMKPIYWKVDPFDWDAAHFGSGQFMVNHIVTVVERDTVPGAIILSHDNKHPDTIAAYRILVPWLMARFKLIALPT
jgi:peptidoglycan-N-acetylglucosamine deacetylase